MSIGDKRNVSILKNLSSIRNNTFIEENIKFPQIQQVLLKQQVCIFLILLPLTFYGQSTDSLKNKAVENFKTFFSNLKSNTKDDSSYYEFTHFSDLEKKYAYPIDMLELSKMKDYPNYQAFYSAHFIRKQNLTLSTQSIALQEKVRLAYNKLVETIANGRKNNRHKVKKEQKLSKKLHRLMQKYKAPHSGYYQKAQIEIHYPHEEKKYLFLIEYSLQLDVVNFGGIDDEL